MIVPATRACGLERDAVPDEDDQGPHRQLPVELDGERVHRDRPDDAAGSPATGTSVPVRSRRNPSAYPTGTMPIQVSRSAT